MLARHYPSCRRSVALDAPRHAKINQKILPSICFRWCTCSNGVEYDLYFAVERCVRSQPLHNKDSQPMLEAKIIHPKGHCCQYTFIDKAPDVAESRATTDAFFIYEKGLLRGTDIPRTRCADALNLETSGADGVINLCKIRFEPCSQHRRQRRPATRKRAAPKARKRSHPSLLLLGKLQKKRRSSRCRCRTTPEGRPTVSADPHPWTPFPVFKCKKKRKKEKKMSQHQIKGCGGRQPGRHKAVRAEGQGKKKWRKHKTSNYMWPTVEQFLYMNCTRARRMQGA